LWIEGFGKAESLGGSGLGEGVAERVSNGMMKVREKVFEGKMGY